MARSGIWVDWQYLGAGGWNQEDEEAAEAEREGGGGGHSGS